MQDGFVFLTTCALQYAGAQRLTELTCARSDRLVSQETKNNLVVSNARMAAQLKDIESQILKLLSESQGNILDDENLINTLAQ